MYLELEALSVRYRASLPPAVDAVSFGLKVGEIGVLIGPSGCGKTTLLRAIAGLESTHSGHIRLNGITVSSAQHALPAEQREMGMVFQDYALFPHMTVDQNIGFGIHAWSKPQRQARILEVLQLVGLQSHASRYPHELSGGQQQRVALARALAPKPKLLLLDEPFSNLDVDLRERLAQELRTILKAAGATALFVTHDQLEAFAIGDRIGVMQQGQLHQWADAYTLYHRPATRFVADFIGHGVFTPAHVELHEEHGVPHKHVVTPLGALHGIHQQEQDRLALGPCDILLRADDIVHDDAAPVKAKILTKAFRGNEFLYSLQLLTGETVLAHVPSHHNHRIGEWIGIRPEVDHIVTFESQALSTAGGN
ncbi:ABC transporter ATP-binding protein [Rhodoferax aquaticus]|uniref:ABC transporter ATP-binding protein n=1 Tax=Rhodoferax aquaticus TaxID=2527691 RepID=A0A515EMG6_9BURK|nr:ABC transporter ATP-binding protein [Rhodoferax aquaticus]QDL53856.1 ABC transporter ATP-binding protein [Rhodoferax aquaticus]